MTAQLDMPEMQKNMSTMTMPDAIWEPHLAECTTIDLKTDNCWFVRVICGLKQQEALPQISWALIDLCVEVLQQPAQRNKLRPKILVSNSTGNNMLCSTSDPTHPRLKTCDTSNASLWTSDPTHAQSLPYSMFGGGQQFKKLRLPSLIEI